MLNRSYRFVLTALLAVPLVGAQNSSCGGSKCTSDLACDDLAFCNGLERCVPTDARADSYGCVAGDPVACGTGTTCSNSAGRCLPLCVGKVREGCALPPCVVDRDCDDLLYCNGVERCQPGDPAANDRGCIPPSAPACAAPQVCQEDTNRCITTSCEGGLDDQDGDGERSYACGGQDCDDLDSNRYHGNREVCDALNHDEDCDPTTFGTKDSDGDGYIDAACCNGPNCGNDCNDSNPAVHPNQPEVCNGIDDNCNGTVDEGVTVPLYPDLDRDGFGRGVAIQGCVGTAGYSLLDNDCDDTNPALFPGQMYCAAAQGSNYFICASDGGTTGGKCAGTGTVLCRPQPNGAGYCL
jgi:hypothetical protein